MAQVVFTGPPGDRRAAFSEEAMKRALVLVIAVGCGLVLAGILMALAVPADPAHTSPGLAITVAIASVAVCLGLAALVLRRQ
jgi:hypothetical protein